MYNKVETNVSYGEEENKILKLWDKLDIKSKCLNLNKGKKTFNFYEGPPTANGLPHPGHLLTRCIKDVFNRFQAMRGYFVPRKGGWDTHGLPVEIAVEKELGLDGKQDIEKYGMLPFIEKCKENVWKYVDIWKEFSNRVGYFVDMEDDCYVTYYDDYIESCWWAIKELYKKGLLYKGYKILPSCPHCGTAISSHELAQGYVTETAKTIIVKFDCESLNAQFLAWTTTPWTLFSNIALCVNPKEEYVLIETLNEKENKKERFILAKALVSKYFENFSIAQTFIGSELVGTKYQPLFDVASESDKKAGYKVVSADYVTLTDGTGIVHIAPAFGEDDNNVGKLFDLPMLQFVDKYGKFASEITQKYPNLSDKLVFDTNDMIIDDLLASKKAFKILKITHEYPHCWRCNTPLMYYARTSWFVKSTAIRSQMVKNNAKVNWIPETIKAGRMGKFIDNNIDWCLSRDRYWGTPLPVWTCDCGHIEVIGSKKELCEKGHIDSIKELHRPYVDDVTLTCPICGKQMKRETEVIDCWFDSGAMPFAQHHYPFENKKLFKDRFPAKFIAEGIDQTRGWFYTMQVLSTALFNKSPYETCIAIGLVVDEFGKKLSKSLKNYTEPLPLINKMGADSVRWNFYVGGQPYSAMDASEKSIAEVQSKFIGTLWNTYSFFVLYAEIDKFDPSSSDITKVQLSVIDKWILSKLNTLNSKVIDNLNNFKSCESARDIQSFVEELSNWYIRRSRKRFWGSGLTKDKEAAFTTLWQVLTTLSKIIAPFVPFISETIYQNLVVPFFKGEASSVHLAAYPVPNKKMINKELEAEMETTYIFAEMGRSARSNSNLKIRQPLAKLYLTDAHNNLHLTDEFLNILKEELNVKQIEVKDNLAEFVSYSLRPQLKTLGPKYGKLLGGIREYLEKADTKELVENVRRKGSVNITIEDTIVSLTEKDLLIMVKEKEGFVSSTQDNFGLVFDANLTDKLISEGFAREFVSKIQQLRKDSGFEIVDRINVYINKNIKLEKIIIDESENIKKDILALSITVKDCAESVNIDLNGENIFVKIEKAKQN